MKSIIENAITNLDDKFVEETILYINQRMPQKKKVLKAVRRLAVCAAASLLLLFGGVGASVAAGNIQAYELLYSLYPDIANKLIPIHESCVDEGIRMNVEAVHVDGNKADIYISLQDTEGNRLDESVDLFDSYSIHTNVSQIGGCSLVSYSEENRMATFLISVQQEEKIAGSYMRFSISKILTGKKELTLELPQILQAEETDRIRMLSEVNLRGGARVGDRTQFPAKPILLPNEEQCDSPASGATITAYGLIDGRLHVQVYYEDILRYDNHGSIYLENDEETVYSTCKYSFWDEERKGSFEEYVFDISPEDIQKYNVMGYFVTTQTLMEGDWQVSFPIENK